MSIRTSAIFGGIAILFSLAVLLVWRGSPYVYGNALQTAVETSDLATIAKLVDVDSVRQELSEASLDSFPASIKLAGGVILSAQVREFLGKSFKTLFIDRTVVPERIASILRGEGALSPVVRARIPQEMISKRAMSVEGGYGNTSDVFLLRFVSKETNEEAVVVMRRNGWVSWKVISIRLSPPVALLLPLRFRKEE